MYYIAIHTSKTSMKITTVVTIFVDIEYRKVTQRYQLDKWSF